MGRQEETAEEMETEMMTAWVSPDLVLLYLDRLANHDPGRRLYIQHDPRPGHPTLL